VSAFELQMLTTGLLLGAASSVHCVVMCAGVAGSLAMSDRGGVRPARLIWSSIVLNLGRVCTYTVIGASIGAIGATILPVSGSDEALLIARWAGLLALSWVGLTLAGLVPVPRLLLRIGYPAYRAISRLRRRWSAPWGGELFVAGLAWGFLPCAMVYGALFHAAFAGTWFGGSLAMLGFGIGTSAPLIAVTAGIPGLRNIAVVARHPKVLAGSLVALAMLGSFVPAEAVSWLCLDR